MASAELLRKTVAEFYEIDETRLGPDFSLQGRGQGSIARAALDAAIRRRVGVSSPSVYSAKTYGELEAGIAPGSTPISAPSPVASPVPPPSAQTAPVSCGVDIERVEDLPKTTDHWEDPFYRANFSPAEIAYCLLQASPAEHFAARWCAKEALKKCDGGFLSAEPKDLEVARDPSGAPFLVHHSGGSSRRLPHALSLSHTSDSAVAVVVKVDAAPPVAPVQTPAPIHVPVVVEGPRRGSGSRFALLLSLVSLALAILALARTYPVPVGK
jgi:holo-[acyl-carrier protein] synthase